MIFSSIIKLQCDITAFELKNRVYDTENRVYEPRKCLNRAVVIISETYVRKVGREVSVSVNGSHGIR